MGLLAIILIILSGIVGTVLVFAIGCGLVLYWAMCRDDEDDTDDYPVRS